MKRIKSNVIYAVVAALGIWNFIMLAFNYYAISMGFFNIKFNGYNVFDLSGGGFSATMCIIFQALILALGIVMLAWGTVGLLKGFGVIKDFSKKLEKLFGKKVGEIFVLVLAVLNVLLMVFLIIFVSQNKDVGCKLRAGVFFAIIIPVVTYVMVKLFGKKEDAVKEEKTEE